LFLLVFRLLFDCFRFTAYCVAQIFCSRFFPVIQPLASLPALSSRVRSLFRACIFVVIYKLALRRSIGFCLHANNLSSFDPPQA
jgi:hypothetical protein